MLRVGTGAAGASVSARNQIGSNSSSLNASLIRLATLRRINSASEDPSGLIAAMSLESDAASIAAAISGAEQASGLLNVADSSLGAATSLLQEIRGNLVSAASGVLSDEQQAALQMEIDAGVEALNRLGATTYNGSSVFDGATRSFVVGSNATDTVELTMPELNSAQLGDGTGLLTDIVSGGSASIASGDLETAVGIVDGALSQVLSSRVSIGSFQRYSLDTSLEVLNESMIQTATALSQIYDTDVAAESTDIARAQVQMQASLLTARLLLRTQQTAASLLDELV